MTIPVAQAAETYHLHECACGCVAWHDGPYLKCPDSNSFTPWQCADCRPYVYEDLVVKGECRPIGNVLAFALPYCVGYFMGIATMAFLWWITK